MRAARKTTEEQYQLVLECRRSGLSDCAWCRKNGISLGTGYYTDSNGNTPLAPHSCANQGQGDRRDVNSDLVFGATDLIKGGMSESIVMSELERNYKMIDALNEQNRAKIERGELALLEYDREAIEQVVHDFAEQQRLEDERMCSKSC